jgi:hypothetical protein
MTTSYEIKETVNEVISMAANSVLNGQGWVRSYVQAKRVLNKFVGWDAIHQFEELKTSEVYDETLKRLTDRLEYADERRQVERATV